MSGAILNIEIPTRTVEEVRGVIARVASMQAREALSGALGKRVEIELRKWFAARASNKQGWKSSGFWRRRLRSATSLTAFDASGSEVTIADPAMNQKVFGGALKGVEKDFLTIPARPEAAGRSARTFGNSLVFITLNHFRTGQGGGKLVGMLVKRPAKRGGVMRNRGRAAAKPKLEVFYWCVAAVWQAPDKKALPPDGKMVAALEDEQVRFEGRQIRNAGGAR